MATTTTTPFPTINVVPGGFRWNTEVATKAGQKGAFLRVGGPQVTRRFLSGAKRSWANTDPAENQTIFHTGYRITGTPDNVRTALRYAGVSDNDINQVVNSAITRDNWSTTMAQAVAIELANREALKGAKPATEGYEWEQIVWFAQNIKSAVIATKTGEQRGAVSSPGRAGAGESISDKIRKLAAGKVLDVSNMDMNTGKGVRTIAAPKTAKSGKFGTARVPIVSNDVGKYIRAIELAYGGDGAATYAQDIQVVRQALANAGLPGASVPLPTQALRVPSPVRTAATAATIAVPGAALAPAPQFSAVPQVASPATRRGTATQGGAGLPAIPPIGNLLQAKRT